VKVSTVARSRNLSAISVLFRMACIAFVVLASRGLAAQQEHPPLAIGAPAPDFCLPGIDGATHCLKEYAASKVLVIAFICDHCPTSQLYEGRIKQLAADYSTRDVALVAIQPNNPEAVRLDEMGYTDVGDSLDEMRIRAAFRHFNFPYLYDGESQGVSAAYGPASTPHVFIFDPARRLRYEGRVDDNIREALVKRRDAREAIDAILAGRPVAVDKTPSIGCSTKWTYKQAGREEEWKEISLKPVIVDPISADQLRTLRSNPTGKLLLIDFWATWCGPCRQELGQFETMYRMYGGRAFDLVTVSINYPDERAGVLKVLTGEHATSTNRIIDSTDIYSQLAAFDPSWNAAVPYTLLLLPGGEVAFKRQGTVDPLELKRQIIANLADDDYMGHQAYWKSAVEAGK